ncbi:MAG: hypothetical protein LBB11_03835 [Puniceicoccales bacterium]|nr:hypothetical protein [Puniceicoccales bacterium]
MIKRAYRAEAASHLRTIALAYGQFIVDFGRAIHFEDLLKMKGETTGNGDVNLLAAVLAKYGYIKDVAVWAWDFDYCVKQYKSIQGTLPTAICTASNDRIHPQFAGKHSGGNFPLSVACCIVRCPNNDYRTLISEKFPVAYSRGLHSYGKWRKKSDGNAGGLWGDEGGFIAFFDGHVEWYENIQGTFYQWETSIPTTILRELLPNDGYFTDIDNQIPGSCFFDWQGSDVHSGLHY